MERAWCMSCLAGAAVTDPPSSRKGAVPIMTNPQGNIAGIDSHKDTIHVAVITPTGAELADREFPTTQLGYRQVVAWLASNSPVEAVGVEGTSSYGVGIAAELRRNGITVVEVNRTRPAERRRRGKTDRMDAYRAARAVLSGEAATAPKNASIEPLRALNVARRSANKALQAAWRQIGCILVNASPKLRDKYRDIERDALVEQLAASRPDQVHDRDEADTLRALRCLARRHHYLQSELTDLESHMELLAINRNPGLMSIKGVGPVVAAQLLIAAGDNPERLHSSASFAALCGTSPIPVSSGRTDRYRLNRGGDRQANWALHQIVKNRMRTDPRTREYRDKHLAKGWTLKAVYRALKRAVAREVFQALIGNCIIPNYTDLRPARRSKNLTLQHAADHFNVWPAKISALELGKIRDDTLADEYRGWLQTA